MEGDGKITNPESRFLMTGGTSLEKPKANPTETYSQNPGWLSDKIWCGFIELSSSLEDFKGFDDDFVRHVSSWEEIYQSNKPLETPWPGKWNSLGLFQKIIVLRLFRTDKVIPALQKLIETEMKDRAYIEPPPFELEKSFEESNSITPIIFILSPGADPIAELEKLADKKGFRSKTTILSLGQGQGTIAMGTWVLLQNCHLAISWMSKLEKIVEDLPNNEKLHDDFRLWLTSMPSDEFPVAILQKGAKLTNEPPKGLRNNLLRSYNSYDPKTFENCAKPRAWKKLLFGLSFFHALILERRKYGALGWNIPYEFSQPDLRISVDQLYMFLNEYTEIPWEALNYMVAEANYGGRVTDPWDRRCIKTVLSDFYTDIILNFEYYLEVIKDFPINDETSVFGLHDNADITSAINDANRLLSTALSLKPRTSGGGGKSQDELLREKAEALYAQMPEMFDVYEVKKMHPVSYEESMNTVLIQELIRFNKLLKVVKTTLYQIGQAIQGFVVMSAELEQLGNSLSDNRVPDLWAKVAYPSLKPLASWIVDFLERLQFMQKWIEDGAPPTFWISGFFFTQSFLTGTMQNFARKYKIPIDTLIYDFEVISHEENFDLSKPPQDGCYIHGLFLDGGRWDSSDCVLAEAHDKVLFYTMPHIWLKPIEAAKQDEDRHIYVCPVYKTSRRAGTLSTTGHSTNFVLSIDLTMDHSHSSKHWIKRGLALLCQLDD
eukprot:CAMPEP_0115042314 /NCGR_PEP_ID=MMETSP0216-20121206/46198_1 /TAXON_ID=223996 /ORGANISM="Protocruzia adherens, Strain Boccale" /LENGTH=717 /DNA_ID=CAMNT_0002424417 /DNA_START=41 /DNA_END=2194 /DNA_ORIENTATION=-